jgi:hypothetical protein
MNEYEFDNDARPTFLSVDEDEASYIGPTRKQSQNDTERPPQVGIALFALSRVRCVPLERVNPSTDSNRCRFDYVSILINTACVRRRSRVSRHPYTLLPPSHSTDQLATRADDHDNNHTPWIVISISIVCLIGMTLHLKFAILLASIVCIASAVSRDPTKG